MSDRRAAIDREPKTNASTHLKSHASVRQRVNVSGPCGVGEAPKEKILANERVDMSK